VTAEPEAVPGEGCEVCQGGPRKLREWAQRVRDENVELRARVADLSAPPAERARRVLEREGLGHLAGELAPDEPDDGPTEQEAGYAAASRTLRSVQVWPDEDDDDTEQRDAAEVAALRKRNAAREAQAVTEMRGAGLP